MNASLDQQLKSLCGYRRIRFRMLASDHPNQVIVNHSHFQALG